MAMVSFFTGIETLTMKKCCHCIMLSTVQMYVVELVTRYVMGCTTWGCEKLPAAVPTMMELLNDEFLGTPPPLLLKCMTHIHGRPPGWNHGGPDVA